MPSRPRSEPELTARSSTVLCTTPFTTRFTWPVAFSRTKKSLGAEEGHAGGLIQIFDYGPHAQIRVDQAWGTLRV